MVVIVVIVIGFGLCGRALGGRGAAVVCAMCAVGAVGGRGGLTGLGRGVGGGTGSIGLDVAVRCGGGLQRGQHPGGHGGAGEAPQDQHHHQQKGEAATHP